MNVQKTCRITDIESTVAGIKLRGGPRLAVTQTQEHEDGTFTVYINTYPAVTDTTLYKKFDKIGLLFIGSGWNAELGNFLRLMPMPQTR
ncbi:MAG: hypothetical protein HOC20_01455 [Chloroflexi bacterium]|jgi:hypothetical protein|nr:hypothetical protein [Chloroflexota bacterium]